MTTHPLLAALVPLVADLSRELPEAERYRRLLGALRSMFPADAAALLRLSAADLAYKQKDFPRAARILEQVPLDTLKPAQQVFASTLAAELAMSRNQPKAALTALAHPSLQHMVPLDTEQGTAFQRKVWKALRGIPPGQTRTYTEVAHAIGQPKAVRAVASACAANPLAVLVPCHRVLRSDGGWGGYRWGLARKQQLLQLEGAMARLIA